MGLIPLYFRSTLGLIPKVLNAIDMIFTSCKQSRMIDAFMVKVTHIQSVVTSIAIGINHTVGSDFAITTVGTPHTRSAMSFANTPLGSWMGCGFLIKCHF